METGGGVIVLTDGLISGDIDDEIEAAVQQKVRVCTIAFGADADPSIEELAVRYVEILTY